MDRKLKILWQVIIICFLIAIAFGTINSGNDSKGKIQVTNILISNNAHYLNAYSVRCSVKSLVELPYLKMKTEYYDKNGNILSENDNCWEGKLISQEDKTCTDVIGYKVGANGILPTNVQILFFDDYNKHKSSQAIYTTNIEIPNKDNGYLGLDQRLPT